MRILVNLKSLAPIGGIETFVLGTSRELARRGHEIDVVYVQDGEFASEYRSFCRSLTKVPPFDISPRGRGPRLLRPAQWAVDLARMVEGAVAATRLRPDVIYLQGMFSMPFGWLAGRLSRQPVVCQMHGFTDRPGNHLIGRQIGRFIAVSEYVRTAGVTVGLEPDWVTTIHGGIDPARFSSADEAMRQEARAGLGLPPDAFVVLYAGRLEVEKGIDVLLDAWRLLGLQPEEGCLLVVGSPVLQHDADTYLREVQDRAAPGCHWLPMQPDIRVPLQAADVVVVPSRWQEPFGLVILEAMAAGKPVVASRVGGIPEILSGCFEEFLFEPGDSHGLADQLRNLRYWRTSRPELARACIRHVEDRFSLRRMVDGIEQVLHEAVAGTPARLGSATGAP